MALEFDFSPSSLLVLNLSLGLIMFGVALSIKLEHFVQLRHQKKDSQPEYLIFTFFNGNADMAIIAAWWDVWHLISGFPFAYLMRRRPIPEPSF